MLTENSGGIVDRRNGVREAGVRALRSGIPGLARRQLDAVPLDKWSAAKNNSFMRAG
jgi:hypothetical protein